MRAPKPLMGAHNEAVSANSAHMMKYLLLGLLLTSLATALPATAANDTRHEVKLAFLVPARTRLSPARPNRHLLMHTFNYALDKINQQHWSRQIRFTGLQVESAPGNESHSIRQLVALISGAAQVNAILGPQDTCHMEARLASAFNLALISYQCQASYQWPASGAPMPPPIDAPIQPDNRWTSTFIQTKPPYWKIVSRVVTLVELLLSANNWYPQQLVLLYFKELHPQQLPGAHSSAQQLKSQLSAATTQQHPTNQSTPPQTPVDAQLTIEAIQYRLIGELLEMELARLSEERARQAGDTGQRPLVVLNWNTTFHYGFTRNPFVRLVRRHLARARRRHHHHQQANQCHEPSSTGQPLDEGASPVDANAIFIVVGHYYEHLGLMLALDEMNLLQHQQEAGTNAQAAARKSVVVGVDTEQYDERYDSARFLHGLLTDQETRRRLKEGEPVQRGRPELVASSIYGHYLGLVPARPTRMADFLADMYAYLERTNSGAGPSKTQSYNLISSQQHLMSARLFQLIRLPVEAFYLFDSMQLLGAYFASCLSSGSSLAECSDGRLLTKWFQNRLYQSSLEDNDTCLDEQAQAEGSYVLISRRGALNDSMQDSSGEQDEFSSLVGQVGRFKAPRSATGCHNHELLEVQFQKGAEEIDPIWRPLWCQVHTASNESSSFCQALWRSDAPSEHDNNNNNSINEPLMTLAGSLIPLLILFLVLVSIIYLWLLLDFRPGESESRKKLSKQQGNGWFNAMDERNFSLIVQRYLLPPEALLASASAYHITNGLKPPQRFAATSHMFEELHCHMFPFPSCKFVHWLTALHRLKEMMFQYQSSAEQHCNSSTLGERHPGPSAHGFRGHASQWLRGAFTSISAHTTLMPGATHGAHTFFSRRHKGTASLRLLLNKYKSVNQCFCTLADLNHESVVRLQGLVLSYEPTRAAMGQSERVARLLVEQPTRGHLREALAELNENLEMTSSSSASAHESCRQVREFRDLLVRTCLQQLLSGLEYLHKSPVQFHGELRATTCYFSPDWRLKLAGFHAHHLRRSLGEYEQKNSSTTDTAYLDSLVYSAPEVLELHNRRTTLGSSLLRLADVYSFAFVAYELISGHEPWSYLDAGGVECSSKLLLERVKVDANFRPPLSRLDKIGASSSCGEPVCVSQPEGELVEDSPLPATSSNIPETCLGGMKASIVKRLIQRCWSQLPDRRPQSVSLVTEWLDGSMLPLYHQQDELHWSSSLNNLTDASLMSRYARQLESVALYRKRMLERERKRSRDLKLKMLPESIVLRLATGQHSASSIGSQQFNSVSICVFKFILIPLKFSNEQNGLTECPNLEHLNEILIQLDRLVDLYQRHIHLIDSPVDSSMRYLAYSGELLCTDQSLRRRHQQLVASFALQLIDLANRCQARLNNCSIQVSCGIHCGPLLAGLMPERDGVSLSCSSRYVLMGPGLTVANSLEQSCLPQRIQISASFRHHLLQAQQQQRQQQQLPLYQDTGSLLFGSQQDYVIMKRDTKACPPNTVASTRSSLVVGAGYDNPESLELFWLVNGPRLTTGQSLLLSQFAL